MKRCKALSTVLRNKVLFFHVLLVNVASTFVLMIYCSLKLLCTMYIHTYDILVRYCTSQRFEILLVVLSDQHIK